MKCHILFTIRNDELAPYSYLVFRTIRIGFPTATIKVWFNGREEELIIDPDGFEFEKIERTTHHEWIKKLYNEEKEPFFICDTDIVFYSEVENLSSDAGITGWLIPQWQDEFTRCVTRSRIHTCLMRIDPAKLRGEIDTYISSYNRMQSINPSASLFAPVVVPINGRPHFYDVCSVLYNAVGGAAFTDKVKDAFFHFNFGTISDIVLPTLKDGERMAQAREMVLNNPELGRGMWRVQEQYYRDRQSDASGVHIEDTLSPADIQTAQAWNLELCKADQNAMVFCDLWHRYCHAIDDLIDTMEDGRPIMSRDQMIGTFLQAAVLYNCAFFVAHRNLLFPIVLDITNVYMMSVQWEKAPQAHLRKMGDVFRTCGNRMYSMVALICGGEEHMRVMSRKITERDYLSQHDSNDQPI